MNLPPLVLAAPDFAAIDTLARTRTELDSTVERLEDWARSLRVAIG